jgi:hypothetical protein
MGGCRGITPYPPASGGGGGSSGFIGSTRPYTWLNSSYSAITSQMAARVALPSTSSTKFKTSVVDPMVASTAGWWGIPAWWAALLYRVTGTSSYGTFAVNNATVPADANGYVGGIDAFIDAENATEAAFNGSNAYPTYVRDSFYNTRDQYANVAYVYDWCYPILTSAQKTKWIAYYNNCLTQMLASDPKVNGITLSGIGNFQSYALMNSFSGYPGPGGVNGDALTGVNPADNYFYGHMLATMLGYTAFGSDNPQASTWRTMFRTTMVDGHMTPFLTYLASNGCGGIEGTGYGADFYRLFIVYDIWLKSTGEDLFALTPTFWDGFLKYLAHQIVPTKNYLTPYGDHSRDSTAALYDTHRTEMQVLINRSPTSTNSKAALALLNNATAPTNSINLSYGGVGNESADVYSGMYVWDFLYDMTSGFTAGNVTDFGNSYKADAPGHASIRTGWGSTDTFVSFSYGRKTQDHDHQDKGAFLIWKNSWLAYDQNINSGSGIQQATDYHNLVAMLNAGSLVAQQQYTSGTNPVVNWWDENVSGYYYLSVELTGVWASPITKNKREIVFFPKGVNGVLVVYDYITTSSAITKRWQMSSPYTPTISTTVNANDTATYSGNSSTSMKLQMIEPSAPSLGFTAWSTLDAANTASNYSGGSLTTGNRLDSSQTSNSAVWVTVIDVGGALTSAVQGTNSAGIHTVNLTFADATTKNLTFYEATTHVGVV